MPWTNEQAVRKFGNRRTGEFMEAVNRAAVKCQQDHGVDFRPYIETEVDTFDDVADIREARKRLVRAGFATDSEVVAAVDAELDRRVPKEPVEETPPLRE